MKIKLKKYDLCRVIARGNYEGRYVRFLDKRAFGTEYHFEDIFTGGKIILSYPEDFVLATKPEYLKSQIDLALDTNDMEWFEELTKELIILESLNKISKYTDSPSQDERKQDILQLIDIALSSDDEEWFNSLVYRLKNL